MSLETVVHLFSSKVWQEEDESALDFEIQSGQLLIRLTFFKVFGSCRVDAPSEFTGDEINILADEEIIVSYSNFLLSSKRDMYTKKLANILSSEMGVPEDEQPMFIEKIFQVVEAAKFPGPRICAIIVDATVRVLGDIQSIINGKSKLIPATKLSIEGLETVRLDSLEAATIEKTPCLICKEGLDHFDDGGVEEEEGIDNHQPMIARLPCLHLYHRACIVQWLEMCHLCPLCRYAMPIMEEDVVCEPSKPSGRRPRRLHWPMVLTISAGGIITAMLLCKLLKQRRG